MSFYRFVSDDLGIYEAVDRDCPRTDGRRQIMPDDSWLNKVGEQFPGAASFWTEAGLKKYLESGIQEWHRSVLKQSPVILIADKIEAPLYQDAYQVITSFIPDVRRIPWPTFATARAKGAILEKVVAYVLRKKGSTLEVLCFRHDSEKSDSGIQVPAGTVDYNEGLEAAIKREVAEEAGLKNLKVLKNLDHYIMYKPSSDEFHNRHVFLLAAPPGVRDQWIHKVFGGGEDAGLSFHFFWLPVAEARLRLSASLGCSLDKIESRK